MIAWIAACAALGPPRVAYDERVTLPLVHPSTDARRWYVPAEVAGLGAALWLVDTGYTNTTCDDALVDALALDLRGHRRTRVEPRGTVDVRTAELPPFRIGGHDVEGLVCLVRDLGATSSLDDPPEVPIAGVLGLDLLSRFRVELDPSVPSVALSEPASAPPDDAVRLRISPGPSPRAKLEVAFLGRSSWMLLDTGTSSTWVDGRRRGWSPTARTGALATYDLAEVAVGGRRAGPITAVQRDRTLFGADLLGLDVISGFRLVLDPARGRAVLDPVVPAEVPAWSRALAASPDGRALVMPEWSTGYDAAGGAPW